MGALRDIHLKAAEKDSAVIFWRADSNTDMRFVGNFAAPLYKSNLFKDLVSSKRTTLHFRCFNFANGNKSMFTMDITPLYNTRLSKVKMAARIPYHHRFISHF